MSYCQATDEARNMFFSDSHRFYKDYESWISKSISCTANSGRFSSDRTINEYCDEIWKVEELTVPKGAPTAALRVKSFPDLSVED